MLIKLLKHKCFDNLIRIKEERQAARKFLNNNGK